MSANLTEFENATVGMTVGCIEVLCLQPLNYMKNMVQQGQKISLSPASWYRGVGANCVNMGSCTMLQFSVGGSLKQSVLGGEKRKLTIPEEMTCGIGAGTFSALVGSPLELIMIQQQRTGLNTVETLKSISSPSLISRGFVGAAVREALWTCGYLSIPAIVKPRIMNAFPETFDTSDKARIPASLLGGLFACYLTHPFDTVKTCMQGDIQRVKFGTFTDTAKIIYSESNITGFYRGAAFRYGRMCIAVGMMDFLKENIGPLLYPAAFA